LQEFKRWLQTNTNLSPTSVRQYVKVMNNFFKRYKELSVENMNKYIREYPPAKYVFKYFLMMEGRVNDYFLLIKAKEKPVEREGVYLPREELERIVFSIPDERYRMVALIQYVTGARASETLKLKKENFRLLEDGRLRIRIIGKGGKESIKIVPATYAKRIWDFVQASESEYPFLRMTSKDFTTSLNTNYRYYYGMVKKAARAFGYDNFATHDFRRNFGEDFYEELRKEETDPLTILLATQKALNHSSLKDTIKYLEKRETTEKVSKIIEKVRG